MEKVCFSGFIDKLPLSKSKYSYYFDGKMLYLNQIESEGLSFTLSDQQLPVLYTRSSVGGNAVFFDCIQHYPLLSPEQVEIKPSYVFYSRWAYTNFQTFTGLTFSSKFINKLFIPTQIVEFDSLNFDHNGEKLYKSVRDGSKTIRLKKWKDVDKEIKCKFHGEDCILSFNISSPGTIKEEDENLGEIKSNFTIKFANEQNISSLKEIYLIVRKFFQFLTNRKNILFDEIKVLNDFQNYRYSYVGDFTDLAHTGEDLSKKVCQIKHYNSKMGDLFKVISDEKVNFNYIPKNNEEFYYVSPEQYVSCCGAFEFNYKKVFIDKIDPNTQIVLLNLKKHFNNCTEFNSKQRSIYKKIIKDLEKTDISVEQKYNRCYKKYQEALKEYIKHLSNFYEIAKTPKSLGKHFSSYRNLRAHGELDEFTPEAICAYLVGGVIIDCLILDKSGYTIEEIKDIVNSKYLLKQ